MSGEAWLEMVAETIGYSPPAGSCSGCGCALYPEHAADAEPCEDAGCPYVTEIRQLTGGGGYGNDDAQAGG